MVEGVNTQKKLVRLIGRGWAKALRADELKVGMHVLYNYEGDNPIIKVEQSGGWIQFTVASSIGDATRKVRPTTLILIKEANR